MASPPCLDLDEFLAPIPGDSPAGGSVPYAIKQQLEEARKEVNPDNWDPNDPSRPEAKKADWREVLRLARETLTGTSKDLLVAARLTEALTQEHGFAGLRDGLRLMHRLTAECWDRLNPAIESEEDLEVRSAPFYWLDDPDRGARFPHAIRMVPIVWEDGSSRYGWFHWKQAQTGKDGLTVADIERAIQAAPRERCQAQLEDITEAWQELEALGRDLNEKMGRYAPSFTGLKQAMGECRTLAQQILQRKGADPSAAAAEEAAGPEAEGAGTPASGSFAVRQGASREEVDRHLAQAAAVLQRLEPHSPIPYLINKAVELGAMPFPDLMRALIRDSSVLGEMNRELGIKEPE